MIWQPQVTILVAADGGVDIPKVNSAETLRSALNRLGGLRSDQVPFCSESDKKASS